MSEADRVIIQSKIDKVRAAASELSDVEDFTTDIEIKIEEALIAVEHEVHQTLVHHKDQMQSYANQFTAMRSQQREQALEKAAIEEQLSNAKTKEVANAQEIHELKSIRFKLETEIRHHKRMRDETEAELNDLKREKLSDAW